MNQTHVHLFISHLPLFGSILGGIVLAYGIWAKSKETTMAAYFLLIISSLGTVLAYITGEGAEHKVEKIQGVMESAIEVHEDAAPFALGAFILLGLIALISIYLNVKKSSLAKKFATITLIIAIFSFTTALRMAYLGGQIRHAWEINDANSTETGDTEEEQQDH